MARVAGLRGFVFGQCFCCLWLLLCFLGDVCLLRILLCCMLCLSAASIAFVSILFPRCASVGVGVFVSVCSISFVKILPVCFPVVCV